VPQTRNSNNLHTDNNYVAQITVAFNDSREKTPYADLDNYMFLAKWETKWSLIFGQVYNCRVGLAPEKS